MTARAQLLVIGASLALWLWMGGGDLLPVDPHAWERDAVVGTWTEPGGPPGNFVQIRLEPHPLETRFGTVTALDGRATFLSQFGAETQTSVVWNFENFHPLRLNIVFSQGAGAGFLAVGFASQDRVRMRLVRDIGTAQRPDVLDHPDAKWFVRVKP